MRPPADIAPATLIAAGADRARYGATAMTLHWLTALLVLTQYGLGEFWGLAPRPIRHLMIVAHMSLGILNIASGAEQQMLGIFRLHPLLGN